MNIHIITDDNVNPCKFVYRCVAGYSCWKQVISADSNDTYLCRNIVILAYILLTPRVILASIRHTLCGVASYAEIITQTT